MSAAATAGYIPARHPLVLFLTVMLGTVMTALDSSIANIALPHMQGSLSATQDQISWVLTSYILATAIFIPPTAFFATRFGRQRLMAGCIVGFLLASMACGMATSLEEMVFYRFLQGACGASIMPLGQTLVMDHFPAERQGQLLALWGLGAMLGPIIGPTLGGYLTEALSWRWVFYINVPVCLLALLGVWKAIPPSRTRRDNPFDLFGFGLLVLAISAFQLLLDRGQSLNWFESTEIVIEALVAGLCFYLFLVHMFTARTPFIEPKLFRDRNLVAGLVIVSITSMVLMATLALLPSFLQQLMHIPANTTGLLMLPRGVASIFGMLLTSRLIGRVRATRLMFFGVMVIVLSLYEMSRINLYVDNFTIARICFAQGIGMAFMTSPLTTVAFSTLLPQLRAEGAAMYNLMRNIGSSIGISVMFTRVSQQTQAEHARIGESITPFADPALLPQAWNWESLAGAMTLDAEITRQAASIAYLDSFLLLAVLVMLTIPLYLLIRQPARQLSK